MKQLRGIEIKRFKRASPKHDLDIVIVLEHIQYAANVANFFRSADAAGVKELVLTGSTQTPPFGKDLQKQSRMKEQSLKWSYEETSGRAIQKLKKAGYKIVALELTNESCSAADYHDFSNKKIALVVGNEMNGVAPITLERADSAVHLPMFGTGASLNVSIAGAVALYTLVFQSMHHQI